MFKVRARRWSRTLGVVVALSACTLVGTMGAAPPASAAVGPYLRGGVFAAMNADRAANGLPALGWNDNLAAFAQSWAQWMAANTSLSHQNLSTILSSGGYGWVAENVLMGGASLTAAQAEAMWMGSAGHRANILSSNASAAGVGAAQSADGRLWLVVDFANGPATGPPPPSGPGSAPGASAPATTVPPLSGAAGEFTSVTPARLLDTRDGTGRGVAGPLHGGQSFDVTIAGRGGVPASGVGAVVLNVTATNSTASSFLTVYPSGTARPTSSNVNVVGGQTVANLVTVRVNAGAVSVFNHAGSIDVIFDVLGWYSTASGPAGSRFHAMAPSRVLDTRGSGPVGPGAVLPLRLTGVAGVPSSGVSAVTMNLTVTGPSGGGYVTAYPSDAARPTASNLNFTPGLTVPNLVTVRVPANGVVNLFNSSGSTHLVVDVVGWYDGVRVGNAGRFVPIDPRRLYDSRTTGAPLVPWSDRSLQAAGTQMVPSSGAFAIVANVTITEPSSPAFLTAYPSGSGLPLASNLNFVSGQTVPNLVAIKLGSGAITLHLSSGQSHVVVDVFGYFVDSTA